ncbi:MAG: hypothetical protein FWD87_05145 [Spirochaetaceae bacterium]|nr:hypothetical protein [Spirochaetaceae bacterium]
MINKKDLRHGFFKQDFEAYKYSGKDICSLDECMQTIRAIADMARDYFLFCEPDRDEAVEKAAAICHMIKVLSDPISEFLFEGAPKDDKKMESLTIDEIETEEPA